MLNQTANERINGSLHGTFYRPLSVELVGVRRWRLLKDHTYRTPQGEVFQVPSGETTDFASVPRKPLAVLGLVVVVLVTYFVPTYLFWFLPPIVLAYLTMPTREEGAPAAVVHDWLYRQQTKKKKADRVFYYGLRACGVSRPWAFFYWIAVTLFGGKAYRRPKLES